MAEKVFTSKQFCMDALADRFEGYTDGDIWNGWACPYFLQEVAEKVLAESEANGYSWEYEEAQDAYVVRNENDPVDYEPEIFEGIEISVEGNRTTVYPIGAYSWVWEICEDE